ncbi:CCA tRNA nucleotidyltransferase [Aliiroseovarius sp. 2305UL8-7]|uniref:CCA tRNA nucleotidyltransferase n=1 Tax=Aliiroseovarius conchicola TaxID=3121637 RepID=UPI003527B339
MNRVNGEWIKGKAARSVCSALQSAGYEVYFVGGCVRNDLLGMSISDLDLSTNARPDQIIKAAADAGLRTVPTGIDHGTITVVAHGEGLEVTSFRKDVETDGRRAVVAFSDSLSDDARRRDFTMNALYATPAGDVVDPLGGLPDLLARRVRFIESADERIREDYLRTLRFFRFHAWYGDPAAGIDPEGLAAVSSNIGGLETLSRERVGAEIVKLLSAPDPSTAVATMAQSGVLSAVLPGADPSFLSVLVHLEAGRSPDAIRRLAVLGGEDVAARLRLSKRQGAALSLLRDEIGSQREAGELAYRHGRDVAIDVLLLRATLAGTDLDISVDADVEIGTSAVFPVRPSDLMSKYSGPALGEELRRLEGDWISSGFRLSREELLA